PPAASTFADDVDRLHLSVVVAGLVVGLGIVGVTLVALVRFRDRGEIGVTQRVEASALREGALISAVLAAFLAWWVVGYRLYVRIERAPEDEAPYIVWVTARQWVWTFT